MQAEEYRITLKAKDMDTVRIRLDFIQFMVTQISIYGFYKSLFFSDSKWFHDHNKPSHEPDTSFPSFKHTVHNHVKNKVQIRKLCWVVKFCDREILSPDNPQFSPK